MRTHSDPAETLVERLESLGGVRVTSYEFADPDEFALTGHQEQLIAAAAKQGWELVALRAGASGCVTAVMVRDDERTARLIHCCSSEEQEEVERAEAWC